LSFNKIVVIKYGIVCLSSIYESWLPLLYLKTFLVSI
jgi:ubiquitin-protein ligase